ncbi:unnamed protein product [Ectocarpus fasciculatus]
MGRGLLLLSMAGALGVALGTTPLIAGTCNGIEKKTGAGFQRGQDEFSLWTREGLPISNANKAEYVRLASKPSRRNQSKGRGKYEFSFNGPLLYGDVDANTLTLELSALVQKGSGDHWQVDILNRRRGNKWDKVGDLSRSGSDWTTSNLVVRSDENFNCRATANEGSQPKRCIDDYFDTDSNEVMVRIRTRELEEVVFVDYARIKASFGFNPHSGRS